jgi:hypothetical protein
MESKGEGRYYTDIQEVEVASTPEEANERLARGYELLKIETLSSMQKLGDLTAQETRRLVFVLGRKKTIEKEKEKEKEGEIIRPSNVAKPNVASTTTTVPEVEIPQSIRWTELNPNYSWAFATNIDGTPIPELKAFAERLKLSPIKKDGYIYSVSDNGKFLQRRKLKRS